MIMEIANRNPCRSMDGVRNPRSMSPCSWPTRPATARTTRESCKIHSRVHRMQFVGTTGTHEFDTRTLLRESWTKAVGSRMPTSYNRLLAMQPLPSTANDLLARSSSLQGTHLEAAIQRAEIERKIMDWHEMASKQRDRPMGMTPVQIPSSERNAQRDQNEEESGSKTERFWMGQSMFDRLNIRQRPAKQLNSTKLSQAARAKNDGHGILEHTAPDPSVSQPGLPQTVVFKVFNSPDRKWDRCSFEPASSCSFIVPPDIRNPKSKYAKKQDLIQERNKRNKPIRYSFPDCSKLMASDQSARASRTSIFLTALAEAEERERETLRTRLWQLINTEGAFSEENKASAREALTSGDSAEARKVIEKAEIRVARHKEFRANLELYSPTRSTTGGQPPADGAEVSSRVLFITEPIDGYHVSDDGVGPATQVSESSHTQGPMRPSTARPCSEHTAEPVTQRKRAQSARCRSTVAQDGSTNRDVLNNVAKANSIEVDHHPLDLSLAPSAKTQSCDSSPDPSACTAQTSDESDEDENADELHPTPKVSQKNSVLDCGAEDDGEKKFKFEKKSDKQHQWERWLNLAEQGKEASGEKETELRNYDDLVPEVKTPVVNMRKKGIARLPETFCFTLQHVQECDLSFNNLSSLPQTIGNLRDLKKLIVTDNRLQGLPFGLGHLKMLLELNIDRNSITRLPCSFAGTDSAVTRGNTPFVLSTRGNTHFVLPPQNLIDEYSCVNIMDIPLRIETLNAIRTNLRHVLLAGIASRDKVWKELDARKMSLSTLLMLLTSPALHLGADTTNTSRNCTSESDLKRAGRSSSTELSFSREHLEEKLRWDIKLVDSKQTFTDLWEFLDEDGNGLLTSRQFFYRMKRPLQKDINTDGMPPDQWVSAVQGVGLHVTIDSKRSESENQK